MKKLELSEKDALRLYPTADKAFKEMLEINFGVEFFNQKITDRIKSFDDILAIANEKGYKYNPNTDDTEDEVAYKKAKLIAEPTEETAPAFLATTSEALPVRKPSPRWFDQFWSTLRSDVTNIVRTATYIFILAFASCYWELRGNRLAEPIPRSGPGGARPSICVSSCSSSR